MSKKFLCVLLSVLMIVLAVPVMAVATVADEPAYSTSFGTVNNEAKNCKNLPTIDENGVVSYYGNWTPISYPKGAYGDPSSALLMDANNTNLDGTIGPASTVGGGGTAGMKITGAAYGGNTNYHAYYGQLDCTSSSSAGIRYTAEKSGTVSITLDAVGKLAKLGRQSGEMRYGIFHNGEMIWPKNDGTVLADTQPLHELFEGVTAYENLTHDYPITADGVGAEVFLNVNAISSLFLFEGDTLDFIVEMVPNDNGWYGMWEGQGNVFFPTIDYTSTLKETEVNASVSLSDGFALSLGFTHIDPIYTNVRVKVNGETLDADENGRYIYNDIAAKEIGDEIDWQVTGMIGTKSTLLAEGTTSIATVLYEGFVKDKEDSVLRSLAIATLNYGAAAQQYFKGMSGNELANAPLSDAEKTVTLTETYTDKTVIATKNEDATVDFASASLLLNDTVDVKYVVVTNKDISNYRLQVSFTSDFAEAEELFFAKCKKGRQEVPYTFKAIVEDISPAAWNVVMYVRVIDKSNGNAVVSDTLRYSPAIYYARMGESADGAAMLKAMMAVYEAANACLM